MENADDARNEFIDSTRGLAKAYRDTIKHNTERRTYLQRIHPEEVDPVMFISLRDLFYRTIDNYNLLLEKVAEENEKRAAGVETAMRRNGRLETIIRRAIG